MINERRKFWPRKMGEGLFILCNIPDPIPNLVPSITAFASSIQLSSMLYWYRLSFFWHCSSLDLGAYTGSVDLTAGTRESPTTRTSMPCILENDRLYSTQLTAMVLCGIQDKPRSVPLLEPDTSLSRHSGHTNLCHRGSTEGGDNEGAVVL